MSTMERANTYIFIETTLQEREKDYLINCHSIRMNKKDKE